MDFAKHVPARLRGRFVAAYQGQYGYWFEFDGSVRFEDVQVRSPPPPPPPPPPNSPSPTAPRLTSAEG